MADISPPPTSATGTPVPPNATTKGAATLFHPTSAAVVAGILASITAFQAASPHPTTWVEWVTGALAAASAAWGILGPKASTTS